MVLPVGIGIDGRISSGIVAPFVYLTLGETRSLPVHDEGCILNFHEVGIVRDKVQTLCHSLDRHITAVCKSGR